ncbi:MAG: HNH endonuclease [Burkholderiales bacterium]|nr:HNH endonuclease [Opitutaceae bacterium]
MPPAGFKLHTTPEGIARRAAGRRAGLDGEAARLHADYITGGLSLAEVGRKSGRSSSAMRNLFECRGLTLRPSPKRENPHAANGCFLPAQPLTEAEIEAILRSSTALAIPPALRLTWRTWSLAERGRFIARLRAHLQLPGARPSGPFSANVEPFAYGHARAHAIVEASNRGKSSHSHGVKIRLSSEGVIYQGQLWYWTPKIGYHVSHKRNHTTVLHHAIWEARHGRPVPRSHVLRFIDGNLNNLVAENLRLITRDQLARENQARALTAQARARTSLLLQRSQLRPAGGRHLRDARGADARRRAWASGALRALPGARDHRLRQRRANARGDRGADAPRP